MRFPVTIRFLLIACLGLIAVLSARAQSERILDYQSDIALEDDGSLRVTETITVMSTGHQFRHGIFRDFPTSYKDPYNNRYAVGFEMLSATCDSVPEKFRVEDQFTGKRALAPHEGLSVLLIWPKGYVTPPTFSQSLEFFFRDNRGALLLASGFLVTLLYYLIAWSVVGRDPARGVIMALYEPPANLSPAAMRYLMRMGYDNKTFAAAILDMAVRGFLKITEESGAYRLTLTGKDDRVLTPDEKQIASNLFDGRN